MKSFAKVFIVNLLSIEFGKNVLLDMETSDCC